MAGKIKHILYRDGRYYARVVVPPELRRIIGKTELREPLGPDKRAAERNAHGAVAAMLQKIEEARQQVKTDAPLREIARRAYNRELALDDVDRSTGSAGAAKRFNEMFGPAYATSLRKVAAGTATSDEAEAAIGWMVDDALPQLTRGSQERADALKALAGVRLEALARSQERDQGEILPREPRHPLLKDVPPAPPPSMSPLGMTRVLNEHSIKPLSELLPLFHEERKVRSATADEHRAAVRMVEEFFGEPKAVCEITRQDMIAYKRILLRTPNRYTMRFPGLTLPEAVDANAKRVTPFAPLSPGTITDKWLAHVKSVLAWAVNNGIIPDNPAAGVRVDEGAGQRDPKRLPFSDADLEKIFGPPRFPVGDALATRDWVLLIALHTGARAAEIAQIKLDGIREERGVLVFEIDGVVKNNASRRLTPVHPYLVERGLLEHVKGLRIRGETRLFPDWLPARSGKYADTIPRWFNRTLLPSLGITQREKCFHSLRHTLKTALARAGVQRQISDAITGHADSSVAAIYIHDVPLRAMADALGSVSFPCFAAAPSSSVP